MPIVPQGLYDRLVAVRRELHRYPELSWQEARTAGVIAKFLHSLDIQHRTNVAGHGVVAEIPGASKVPCVVLRADTDALPIQEETGLEFASVHNGIMHACGHDGHIHDVARRRCAALPRKRLAGPGAIDFPAR